MNDNNGFNKKAASIIRIFDEIAFQTSLHKLNAAIERRAAGSRLTDAEVRASVAQEPPAQERPL
ncbi:MAG TPA: hypothetical protein VMJ75_28715 [Candidatus Acidoferrales bacterium]|nr:hypothetical protein [Candidatus Acidoferrales bacterium]